MEDTISPEELKERLDKGEKINLVDVREPHEHEAFDIGGQLIPLGRIQTYDIDELEPLKEEEIIVYCRSGNRSGQAAMILETMGFEKVRNLEGGMKKWEEQYGA